MGKILYSALFLLCFVSIIELSNAVCDRRRVCNTDDDCPDRKICMSIGKGKGKGFCKFCPCKEKSQCRVVNSTTMTCACDDPNFSGEYCNCEAPKPVCTAQNSSYIDLTKYIYPDDNKERIFGQKNREDCKAQCSLRADCMAYIYQPGSAHYHGICYLSSVKPYSTFLSSVRAVRYNIEMGFKNGCKE